MSGIIEIWRRPGATTLPVRFTVGSPAMLADGTADGPTVRKIIFRESGTFAGLRLHKGVFCISFEDSFIQRFIPEDEIVDAGYETKQVDAVQTPPLED